MAAGPSIARSLRDPCVHGCRVGAWDCSSEDTALEIRFKTRLATSICRLRHDQMEQDPTEPHAGCSTFLLSSGGEGGRYY